MKRYKYPQTQKEKYDFIDGKEWWNPQEDDWLPLGVGWLNIGGDITVILNYPLREGQHLKLSPNGNKKSEKAPDYILVCKRQNFSIENGIGEINE